MSDEQRWFGPDQDGNVMTDGELADALEADSIVTDFVASARVWGSERATLLAFRDKVQRSLVNLGRPVGLTPEHAAKGIIEISEALGEVEHIK